MSALVRKGICCPACISRGVPRNRQYTIEQDEKVYCGACGFAYNPKEQEDSIPGQVAALLVGLVNVCGFLCENFEHEPGVYNAQIRMRDQNKLELSSRVSSGFTAVVEWFHPLHAPGEIVNIVDVATCLKPFDHATMADDSAPLQFAETVRLLQAQGLGVYNDSQLQSACGCRSIQFATRHGSETRWLTIYVRLSWQQCQSCYQAKSAELVIETVRKQIATLSERFPDADLYAAQEKLAVAECHCDERAYEEAVKTALRAGNLAYLTGAFADRRERARSDGNE